MKLHRSLVSLIIALIVLLLISQSASIVSQGQVGVRLHGDRVESADLAPGLHLRVPFVQHIVGLDSEWITLDSTQQNGGSVKFTTQDGKTLDARYVAVWRITDAALFCTETNCDEGAGARRIGDRLTPALRQIFADHSAAELTSAQSAALLASLPGTLNPELKKFGVAVRSVDLTMLSPSQDERKTVYQRMRAAQADQVSQTGAKGSAAADQIRAQAEEQRAELLAKAAVQSQTMRGEAEAEAAAIYAQAYQQNPDFYRFYRSLQAYKQTIKNGNSVIVLGPDSGFLKYFDGLKGSGATRP